MKILHVYSGNLYGGIESFLVTAFRHASAAPEMSSEFALCFEGRLEQELEAAGARVHRLGNVRTRVPWSVTRARARLAEVVRTGDFDAVVCHSPWAQAVFGGVARQNGAPAVFWLHEAVGGKHWLERWAKSHRPSFCIANSHYSKSTLGFLFRDVPSAVVYCPVELTPVRLAPDERQVLRHELGADPATTIIVQTSRMQPLKGQKRLLRALARLPNRERFLCLEIGGPQRAEEEAYFEELRAETALLGLSERVRFLGQRSDVPRLLSAADVYCQPNAGIDSFGVAFIEALAAGLPIVTSDMGGPREIVTPEVGFLVGDDATLAETLERLIDDTGLRRRLGERGPARARELCDPAERVRDMARVLEIASREARSAEAAA